MQIIKVKLDDLKVFEDNPRKHGDDVVAIVKSIEKFGWTNPILIQKGTNRIIAGHGRAMAAVKAGLKEVPAIELELNDADATAYTIADNRLAELSEWDFPKLKDLLVGLDDGEFDLSSIGADDKWLKDMVEYEKIPTSGDPDEVPPVPKTAKTKMGDLYILGNSRLLCGDSRNSVDVARVMDGQFASCMWTDPPYGVNYVGKTKDALTIQNDGGEGLDDLLSKAFSTATATATALKPGAAIYIAHPAGAKSVTFGKCFLNVGWRLHETLIWVKDTMVLGHSDYHYRHEPILFGYAQGEGRFGRGAQGWYGPNNATSVFEFPKPSRSEEHPTMKPVSLVAAMLTNSTQPDEIVYEPFMGSGTTLIAATGLGRRCFGIEIDPIFCDVIISRWEKLTGLKSKLEVKS